jgi:hypothetical protein
MTTSAYAAPIRVVVDLLMTMTSYQPNETDATGVAWQRMATRWVANSHFELY